MVEKRGGPHRRRRVFLFTQYLQSGELKPTRAIVRSERKGHIQRGLEESHQDLEQVEAIGEFVNSSQHKHYWCSVEALRILLPISKPIA